MWLGTRHPVLRCAAVWLTATAAALVGAAAARPGVARVLTGERVTAVDAALVELASCALLGCAAWLWASTTLTVAQALGGCPLARATGVRRWVLVACGVAVLSGTVSPALAAPGHHRPAATSLPYPDRAVAPTRVPHLARETTVLVRPGDSLWVIARRDLGAQASDADITARWHAVYAANRARIGPDPDLVTPGLRLLLPGKDPS